MQAELKHNIELKQSIVIGDSERDITAGEQVGCYPIRVERNSNCGEIIAKNV